MADEELQGGAPPTEDPQQAQQPQHEPDGDPDPVEQLATEIGWKPQDQFTGPAEQWKPADEFIKNGREISRSYLRDLRDVRQTLETVSKTSAQIMADRLEEQRAQLAGKFNEAVEDGDAAKAYQIGQRIDDLGRKAIQTVQPPAPRVSGEAEEFQQRHANWFGKDPAATARAVQVCNQLATDGVTDHATQLQAAERVIKAEYPEHFAGQQNGMGRPAPGVHAPGSRAAPSSSRERGFHDMPKAAQDIARDMENRGVIAKTDDYVRKYWQNAGGNA